MSSFVVPDHLRSGLFGWSWNKKLWPGRYDITTVPAKKALLALSDAIMEEPVAKHFLARGRFYIEHGSYEKALADYNQVVHEKPSLTEALSERADLHLLLQHDELCLHDLNELRKRKPNEALVDLKLSYVQLLLGNFYDAQFYLQLYESKVIADPNAKLIGKYLLNFKRRMHLEIGVAELKLKAEYSEENLLKRAQVKEKAFDLVGAAEDYLMLYLLFEREEYREAGNRVKMKILELKK